MAEQPLVSFASAEGIVLFSLIGEKPNDPAYADIMNENLSNLLAVAGFVYDYMHKTYPNVNSQMLDINTWTNVVQTIPGLVIGKAVSKSYRNSIPGVSIPNVFLSLISKAFITEGSSLLTDFTAYLNSIGDVVFRVHATGETYKALIFTISNYLRENGVGGYYDYGAITLRQIEFAKNFMALKGPCANINNVGIDMSYTEIESIVRTNLIRPGGRDYQSFMALFPGANVEARKSAFAEALEFFHKPAVPQNELKWVR